MTALTADRNTPRRHDRTIEAHPAKGGVTIFAGALTCLNAAGFAVPGSTALGLVAIGRAESRVAAAADGSETVTIRRDILRYANSGGGDAITRADIGKQCFVVDDQTVAKTNGGNTRSLAGIIRDVDAQGVWIDF